MIIFPTLFIDKMGERYNIHSQLEHLQSKYIGTGHADTTKWEWVTNQHRDSFSLFVVRLLLYYYYYYYYYCFIEFFCVLPLIDKILKGVNRQIQFGSCLLLFGVG